MASTYSTNLKLELIGTGDQSGTWGATTNTNMGTLIEQAIAGYATQAVTDSGVATVLTIPDGASSTGRNYVITLTGALTAARTVEVPAVNKPYIFFNNTTGGYAVTVKVTGQTGVVIANGKKAIVYTNSTDVIEVANAPATEAGTQTLTNKTLTNPTINGFTGDTSVINVGSGQLYKDASGNVGVGTSSPGFSLDISQAAPRIRVTATTGTNSSQAMFVNTGGIAYVGLDSASGGLGGPYTLNMYHTGAYSIVFSNNNTERMRIDSSGNVGIGTSSPAYKLDVQTSAGRFQVQNFGAGSVKLNSDGAFGYNAATTGHQWQVAGTEYMRIDSSGNVGIGTSSSAYKLQVQENGNLNATSSITNTTAGTSSLSRFLAISDAGSAAFGFTSSTYTDITGAQDALLLNASNASGGMAFALDGVTKMKMDSSGNVGIGTSSPTAKLHSYVGTATQIVNLIQNSVSYLNYGTFGAGESYVYTGAAYSLLLGTNNTERMRIDSSGNLLVGTTASAVAQLQVYTSGTTAVLVQSGTNCYGTGNISGTGTYNGIVFSNNGYASFVASVQVFASSVAYNTSSDARLKMNVQDAAPVLDLVNAVQVRSFDWKNTGEHQRYGMVAQELQVIAPEFVNDQLDDDHTLGIDYSKLVPMLTKAIQELSAKNDALEARLAKLENV
jgi:hypothetical protein